jgi:uncharacterized protein (TIGR00251 family)
MIIEVHVIPKAKKREIRLEGQCLKVKIVTVPQDGKANAELVDFLADFFRVRKSEVRIVKGVRERKKLVSMPLEEEELMQALNRDQKP